MPRSDSYLAAFDMDGVIADTKQLVLKAYRHAGVRMRNDQWGLPWQDWLPDAVGGSFADACETHERKNKIYMTLLRKEGVPLLPPAAVFLKMYYNSSVELCLLTGASRAAATRILDEIGVDPDAITMGTGMSISAKGALLSTRHRLPSQQWSVYVDDLHRGKSVAAGSRSRFIQYVGQTEQVLEDQIWMR